MATWWTHSPYYDIGIYLTDGETHGDSSLTSTWASTVAGQGWGVIPIWDGPQAPCACKYGKGTYPNCTDGTFAVTIDEDTSSAKAQGESEAGKAEQDMQNLGLGKTIIYADLELYDSSYQMGNNTCGQYVQAYVEGWDTQLANDA